MSDSPYQPPPSTQQLPQYDNRVDTGSRSLLPFAQLGLRLLGVMLIVDGLASLFGGAIQGLLQAQAYADAGYSVLIDPHSAGWAAGGIPYLAVGVYLTVGGNWVLRNVFASSNRSAGGSLAVSTVESGEPADARESPS